MAGCCSLQRTSRILYPQCSAKRVWSGVLQCPRALQQHQPRAFSPTQTSSSPVISRLFDLTTSSIHPSPLHLPGEGSRQYIRGRIIRLHVHSTPSPGAYLFRRSSFLQPVLIAFYALHRSCSILHLYEPASSIISDLIASPVARNMSVPAGISLLGRVCCDVLTLICSHSKPSTTSTSTQIL